MEQDAGDSLVGHRLGRGLAILHGKINGRVIKLVSLACLSLHGVIAVTCQGHIHAAIRPGGDGAHQSAIADTADLEGGVGDALSFVRRIDLDKLHAANGGVVKIQGLRIVGVDYNGLGAGIFVDGVTVDGFFLRYHQRTGDALENDLPVFIGIVQTVGADFPVFVGDELAGSRSDLEGDSRQRLLRHSVQLVDNKRALTLVPEGQILHRPCLDENVLGCAVQHESIHRFDLTGNYGSTGFQTVQNDLTRLVRVVHAVIGANGSAAAIHHLEGNARKRLVLRSFDIFVDHQCGRRLVVKGQAVGYTAPDHNVFWRLILDIADGRFILRHDNGGIGGQTGNGHSAVRAGDEPPVVRSNGLALTVLHNELRLCQRFLCQRVPLQNGQVAEGLIVECQRRVFTRLYRNGLGCAVQCIPLRGTNFLCHDGRTGRQLRELDGTGLVRGELAVGGADERTLIVGDEEGRVCQRRFVGIIRQLLDEDGAVRLVAEPERHHILILTAQ